MRLESLDDLQLLRLPPEDELVELEQRLDAELRLRSAASEAGISLASFTKGAWRLLEPRRELRWNWHLDVMCDVLERVTRGEIRRLIINIPPGFMKSLMVSVFWPSWEWLTNPWLRIQCLSAADSNVTRDARKMRAVVSSQWYTRLARAIAAGSNGKVPPWQFGPKAEERWYENTATGLRQSLTIESKITGARAHRQVIDDPHDASEVLGTPDQADRNLAKTIDRVEGVLSSRIEAEDGSESFVLIMQRLHDNDLTGYWLTTYPDTVHVCLPMHYDASHPNLSPLDQRTEDGELLHPAYQDAAVVAEKAVGLTRKGGQVYAQHEQRPRPSTGTLYRPGDWREYDTEPWRLTVDDIGMAIDPNVKETRHGSYFCAQVWGRRYRSNGSVIQAFDRFLLDRYSARVDHDEARAAVIRLRHAWPSCSTIAIEDKANGPALASDLKQQFGGVVLVPRVSTVSKEVFSQIHGVPPCRAGETYLPIAEHAQWIHEFRERVERFPATPNDDADTMAIMFYEWARVGEESGFVRNVNAFGFLG